MAPTTLAIWLRTIRLTHDVSILRIMGNTNAGNASRNARLMRAAAGALAYLPPALLSHMDSAVKQAQGFGWGAGTVDAECAAAIGLLSPSARSKVVALDVGANIGNWSAALFGQQPHAQIVALEPSGHAFKALEHRFGSDPRITLLNIAAGREASSGTLYADAPGSGLASLTQRDLSHHGLEFSHHESVKIAPLDSVCTEIGLRPNVLKMDVEGHELDVLAGAQEILSHVEVIQFEFGGSNVDTRTYIKDFYDFLSPFGYSMFRVTPRRVVPLVSYRESFEVFQTTNLLASRNPHA